MTMMSKQCSCGYAWIESTRDVPKTACPGCGSSLHTSLVKFVSVDDGEDHLRLRPRLTHWIGTRESPCSNMKDGDRLDTREVAVTCAECYLAIAKSKESSNGLPRSVPTGSEGGSLWGDHPSFSLTKVQAAGLADGFGKFAEAPRFPYSDKVRDFQAAVEMTKVDGIIGPETIAEVLKCIEGDTPAAMLRNEVQNLREELKKAQEELARWRAGRVRLSEEIASETDTIEPRWYDDAQALALKTKCRALAEENTTLRASLNNLSGVCRGGPSTEQLFESQLKEIVDLRIEVEKWKTRVDNTCAATSAQVKAKNEEIKHYKDLADYNYEQILSSNKRHRTELTEAETKNQHLTGDLNALRVVYADLSRKNSALQGDFDLLKASMEAAHGGDTCEQMQKGHDRLGEAYNKLYFAAQKYLKLRNDVWMDIRGASVHEYNAAKNELQGLVAFGMEKK